MGSARPRLAIIGSGLAGVTLANQLSDQFEVVVFERGNEVGEAPNDIEMTGHPRGMNPMFYYGLGGTTRLWAGGLIDLEPEEFSSQWPAAVANEVPSHYTHSVTHLYGEEGLRRWQARMKIRRADDAILTSLLYAEPYRATSPDFFSGVELSTDCFVERIEEHGPGVRLWLRRGEETNHRDVDLAIICAGGLNSPLLLHRSGIGGASVGRGVVDHPMGFFAKIKNTNNPRLRDQLRSRKTPSAALVKLRDDATGLWTAFYLRAALHGGTRSDPYQRSFKVLAERGKWRRIAAAVSQFHDADFMAQAIEERLNIKIPSRYSYVLAVCEQDPAQAGRVMHRDDGTAVYDWQVGDTALGALRRNLKRFGDIMEADLIHTEAVLKDRLFSGAHISGGCALGAAGSGSVVDENLLVRNCARIFVCDGSVLPSNGASNTGLTIMALAMRLAAHLRDAYVNGTPGSASSSGAMPVSPS